MEIDNIQSGMKEIFTPYIVKKGVRIYPKNGRLFHFWVKDDAHCDTTYKQLSIDDLME